MRCRLQSALALSPMVTMVMLLLLMFAAQAANAQEVSSDLRDKFSCEGRTAGFYADIPSGCQLYHMCDEAGRVFTHTCPERTLFQQRTMVCDHWYMVECSGAAPSAAPPRARPSARRPPAAPSAPAPVQVLPLGGDPQRKRHSQRVIATFPYQRGNDTKNQGNSVRSSSPQDKLESFKISSLPSSTPPNIISSTPASIVSNTARSVVSSTPRIQYSSTPRIAYSSTPRSIVSSTATIERVERPSFFSVSPFQSVQNNQEGDLRNFSRPSPTVGRAKIERVFKESVLGSPGEAVISQVQYVSPFREPEAEVQFASTTPRPTTQAEPTFIENKYNNNPYFENYFRTSFVIEPSSTARPAQTTTRSYARREEEDISENKLELVIPDPRKMFYIPDSNYDPGESIKEGGTVLVIELPGTNSMKFQRVEVTEARNHDCPQCHPSFLLPGLCRPCVLIR